MQVQDFFREFDSGMAPATAFAWTLDADALTVPVPDDLSGRWRTIFDFDLAEESPDREVTTVSLQDNEPAAARITLPGNSLRILEYSFNGVNGSSTTLKNS